MMQSVERDVEEIVRARLAGARGLPAQALHRVEEFAVTHMKSLALGAAGAVLSLASLLAISDQSPMIDDGPVIVGSIADTSRVPGALSWHSIRKPVEMITIQAPQFQQTAVQYVARANASGGREDTLLLEPGNPGMPEAKITLRRGGVGTEAPSLFIDITRQQAERGVAVTRASLPGKLLTKFGEIDVADMTFGDDNGRSQSCLAFRSSGPIALTGWYCAAQGNAAERPELGCLVDRLTLLKSGEDKALRAFFTEAEQRRRPCPTSRISTGRKPTWLDTDGKAPAMRLETTGSIGEKPRR